MNPSDPESPLSEPSTPQDAQKPAETFTQSAAALEAIVDRFRAEALPLEDSLTLFETGVQHIKFCQKTLTETRGKVEVLVKSLQADDDTLTPKAFE
ncbi:MAG: exodeoxyribonuclease VII small subunit [Cyanobacteria bacterium P01_H01_bin.74]